MGNWSFLSFMHCKYLNTRFFFYLLHSLCLLLYYLLLWNQFFFSSLCLLFLTCLGRFLPLLDYENIYLDFNICTSTHKILLEFIFKLYYPERKSVFFYSKWLSIILITLIKWNITFSLNLNSAVAKWEFSSFGNWFLKWFNEYDMKSKDKKRKNKLVRICQAASFFTAKETVTRVKIQLSGWGICKAYI